MNEKDKAVSSLFQEHFATLCQVLQSQIDTVANELFSYKLIPQDVLDYESTTTQHAYTSKVLIAFQNALMASEQKSRIERLVSLIHILFKTTDKAVCDIADHMRTKLMQVGVDIPITSTEEQEPISTTSHWATASFGQPVRQVVPEVYYQPSQRVSYTHKPSNHRRVSYPYSFYTTANQVSNSQEVTGAPVISPSYSVPLQLSRNAFTRGRIPGITNEIVFARSGTMDVGGFREHYSEPATFMPRENKVQYPDYQVQYPSHPAGDLHIPYYAQFPPVQLLPQNSNSTTPSTIYDTPTPIASDLVSHHHPLSTRLTHPDSTATDLSCSSQQNFNPGELSTEDELIKETLDSVRTIVPEEESNEENNEEINKAINGNSRLEKNSKEKTPTAVSSQKEEGPEDCKQREQGPMAGISQLVKSLKEKLTFLEHENGQLTTELEEMKKQHQEQLVIITAKLTEITSMQKACKRGLEEMKKQHQEQHVMTTRCTRLMFMFSILVIIFAVVCSCPSVYVINPPH